MGAALGLSRIAKPKLWGREEEPYSLFREVIMKKFLTALAVTATFVLPASAQDYYKGKTVTYIIATNPGGNYDAYGRLVGRHLEKKLGAAKIIFKNLPGAGHIIGANTLAASKPDGLTIGTFNTGLIYGQILNDKAIRFNLNDLSWVGKAAADARVLAFSNNSGLKGFEDLLNSEEEIKLAASGVGSASYIETKMLVDAFDLNVKMIPGFRGNEGEMSMLRGEVAGQIATNARSVHLSTQGTVSLPSPLVVIMSHKQLTMPGTRSPNQS